MLSLNLIGLRSLPQHLSQHVAFRRKAEVIRCSDQKHLCPAALRGRVDESGTGS
jgi:hypothetical protein